MRGTRYISVSFFWTTVALLLPCQAMPSVFWRAPFDTATTTAQSADSALSLSDALRLAAAKNPTLKSLGFDRTAVEAQLVQAGLWSNPEFEFELEDIGWNAPGLQGSEITLSIAQELELFGQRAARKNLARTEIDATELHARVSAFDLYLEVKRRFYTLAHARQRVHLSKTSVDLANDVVRNIDFRIGKGAGLQSELLLAQLEKQRTQLMLDQAQQDMIAAEAALVAMWNGQSNGVTVTASSEPDLAPVMRRLASLMNGIDSTRDVMSLHRQSAFVHAQQSLAAAQTRPSITLSGGLKRLEATNSNTFLIGISLPLPLFDRMQGTRQSLSARLRSLDHQIDRERLDAAADVTAHSIRMYQLMHRHDTLDSLLLPTADQAYETLRRAYEAGRVPYTQLLEAERSLNELRFEHNDMLLAIQQQIIALESLTGIVLRIDKED